MARTTNSAVPLAQRLQRWLVFDTHPIQYREPVFTALGSQLPALKVYYFSERFDGRKWWFHEYNKTSAVQWRGSERLGFQHETLGFEKKSLFSKYVLLGRILAKEKPAGVAIYGWYLPEHWFLWAQCWFHKVPLIFIGETFSRGRRWRRWLKGLLHPVFFRGIRQVVAIGERTSLFYRSLNIPKAKITEARYCIDVDYFRRSKTEAREVRTQIRKRLGIPDDAFILVFVGRMFERKRPQDVLALYRMMQKFKNFFVLMVGTGPLLETLKNQSVAESRMLFTGFQHQSEIKDIYHSADLLFVPSEYETWGLVVNEAFACRLPALVTESCGVAGDLVIPGKTGFLYPKGNISKASSYVEMLLSNPVLRARLGEKAFSRVSNHYGVSQFAKAMVKAFAKASRLARAGGW